eukprot:611996-Pleurochrysis_carterae.AAC.5
MSSSKNIATKYQGNGRHSPNDKDRLGYLLAENAYSDNALEGGRPCKRSQPPQKYPKSTPCASNETSARWFESTRTQSKPRVLVPGAQGSTTSSSVERRTQAVPRCCRRGRGCLQPTQNGEARRVLN